MRELAELQRPGTPPSEPPDAGRLPLDVDHVRTFDTPEFAGMRFLEVRTRTALNRVRGMPFDWSINPYRGCSHACTYCFARPTHAFLNLSPGEDFERAIVVKTNVVEVLRAELARRGWRGEHVAMGTNTDPYQRCEGRYALMPGIIDALAAAHTPFSILTKGTLVTRDVDRLAAAAERVEVSAAFTIGMLDEDLWRACEPGTPSPRARLAALRRLSEAGIPTGVMLAPIMPGLNDDRAQLAELVDAAVEAGARSVTPIVLHLRTGGPPGRRDAPPPEHWANVRELFLPWLRDWRPDLAPRYEDLYTKVNAPADYRREIEGFVAARRRDAWRRHGRPPPSPPLRSSGRRAERAPRPEAAPALDATAEQLRLW